MKESINDLHLPIERYLFKIPKYVQILNYCLNDPLEVLMPRSLKFDFTNSKGENLSGRLELPNEGPKAIALFAHCFTCSKNILAASRISKALATHSIGVLRFDFTGIGNSEGDFANTNFSSNVDDLISAYYALKESYMAPELIIGHSLGGAAVLKAAPELEALKAVVTIAAPSDVHHVSHLFESEVAKIEETGEACVNLAGRKFKIKKQFLEDIRETSILESVGHLKKALLVMHSPTDDTVSVEHAAKIYQAAKHPKSYVSLDTADHLIMNPSDAEYAAQIIGSWCTRYLNLEEKRPSVEKQMVLVKNRDQHKFTHDIYTSSHKIIADEPKSIKGDDLGMTPYELLLAALGACTSMTLRMYADRKEWPLEHVEVKLGHQKIHASDCESCETQNGKIDKITKKILLSGNLDDGQKAKLYEIAEKCPVNRTLLNEVLIESIHP
jgi:putative redox protein